MDALLQSLPKEDPARPEWMLEYYQGMSEARYCSVVMDGERHAIVKQAGHMAWTNIISPWHWERTTYELVTKKAKVYRDLAEKKLGEGRLTKAMREQFVKLLREADRKKGKCHGAR